MNLRDQQGEWTVGPIAGLVILVLALIGLFAVCSDDEDGELDGHAPIILVSHDYDRGDEYGGGDYENDYGNRGENSRGRDRGSFSPGPFDDSPVDIRDNCVSLDCGGREGQRP